MSSKCTATTAAGHKCKAWAMHGTKPKLCSAHAGLLGAPKGNKNAVKHGFYRSGLSAEELAVLLSYSENMTLDDELAIARVMLRRLLKYLNQKDLMLEDLAHVAPIVFSGARTIAYLLRDIDHDGRSSTWDEVLDKFSEEMSIRL